MAYIVVGPDGSQSSVESAGALRSWQLDGRLAPGSHVLEAVTGRRLEDDELERLLSGDQPRFHEYPRSGPPESAWPIVSVAFWSIAALVLFFVFRGWGFIIAAFTLWDAIRLRARGSKWGNPALAVAGLTVLVLAWGWYDRLSSRSATDDSTKPAATQSPGP